MKVIRVFGIAGIALLGTAIPAFADPVSLIATSIHAFLLTSTAVSAAAAGTIATVAANVIVAGSTGGGFTFLSEETRHDRV